MHFIKDPTTGKRVSRMNPKAECLFDDVPDLRIVDQDIWDAVVARLAAIRKASGADARPRPAFHERRRAQHILTGKVFCASCGSGFGAVGQDYLSCNAARRQGTCGNRASIRRAELETLILDALRHQLMQPEHVAEFVAAYTAEWNRLVAEQAATTAAHRRELDSVTRKLDGLIDAIADGLRGAGVQQKLDTLEARKAELARLIATSEVPSPRLHPNLAETYRAKVTDLHEALKAEDGGRAALEAVRSLIERVEIGPPAEGTAKRAPTIVLTGEIASMVALALEDGPGTRKAARFGAADHDLFARSVKVVAGIGFEPMTFRL